MDAAQWLLTIFGLGGMLVGIPMGMGIQHLRRVLRAPIRVCRNCGWQVLDIQSDEKGKP